MFTYLKLELIMIQPHVIKNVMVDTGLYVTQSGHVAFVTARPNVSATSMEFSGTLVDRMGGKNLHRSLSWVASGHCSSNEARDHILRKDRKSTLLNSSH